LGHLVLHGSQLKHRRRATLHIDCATYGVHHARKLDQCAVTGGLDDASMVLLDFGISEFAPVCFEGCERTFLVRTYEARVADYVGGEDSSETALGAFFGHTV
jgi:hypothetical protein